MALSSIDNFVLLAAGVILALYLRKKNSLASPLPPGPPGLPIIGNLLDWPWDYGWLAFTDWSKRYGNTVYIQIFGVKVVILTDIELCQTLLSQAIYSDRPHLTMAGELMGFSPSLILCRYGDHWKSMRKLINRTLNKSSSQQLWPSIVEDSHILLQLLYSSQGEYSSSIRYVLGKNIIENTYGLKIQGPDNKYIRLSRETHKMIEHAVIPGNFLVDIFPILKYMPSWIPGAGFISHARTTAIKRVRMVNESFEEAQTSGSNTALVPSLLRAPPENWKLPTVDYQFILKWAAASLYGAGTESSASVLSTFIVMMAANPEIQRKAQEEIDAITGRNRLPTFEDRDQMPYTEAIIKETIRFNPPTPMGIAHQLSAADYFNGHFLPKDTIIITNIWGMCRDPNRFKSPDEFKPERFLASECNGAPEPDPSSAAFGFGRRSCPGFHYSKAVLYINIASILSVFSIVAEGQGTNKAAAKPTFTGGFLSYPKPFPCKIIPRSQAAEDLILSSNGGYA